MPNSNYSIAYIGGSGRSGSTLLELILGELDDWVAIGEVKELYKYSLDENMPCGCGTPLNVCDFWSSIHESLNSKGVDYSELASINQNTTRSRNMLQFLVDSSYRKKAGWLKLVEAIRQTYDEIAALSGAKVIVDSSKSAIHLALLVDAFGEDRVRLIHQVRDPRGVSYSWSKNIKKIKTKHGDVKFPKRPFIESGVRWLLENYALERSAKNIPCQLMRYETFTSDPARVLSEVLSALGFDENIEHVINASGVVNCYSNNSSHAIGGNPMRQNAETITIRPDNNWRAKLSSYDKIRLGAITYPLLRRYGYHF